MSIADKSEDTASFAANALLSLIKNNNIIIPNLIYNKSIVKKYFIDRKKYFFQI